MTSNTLYFDMVRYRPRAQALKAIKDINNHRHQQKSLRDIIFDSDDDSGIDSDDSLGNEYVATFLLVSQSYDIYTRYVHAL